MPELKLELGPSRPRDPGGAQLRQDLWESRRWLQVPVLALVSYANALRHKGDIYRFDGWRKVAEVKGGRDVGGVDPRAL